MKFPTAIGFIFAGLVLLDLPRAVPNKTRLAICSLSILGSMVVAVTGALVSLEDADALQTIAPNMPSVGTMSAFAIVSVCGLLRVLGFSMRAVSNLMLVTSVFGAIGLAGWALNEPVLYYYWESSSTGMSPWTAGLFVLLGAAYAVERMLVKRREVSA